MRPSNVIAPPKSRSKKSAAAKAAVVSETLVGPHEKLRRAAPAKPDFDLVVIGAGPGGYVAAIRAAQLGLKTACVEKGHLGGTCLNVGCIPSKVMIAAVERFEQVQHAERMGIVLAGPPTLDFAKMMERKDKVVQTQRGGVASLFKKNGVTQVNGLASFVDKHTVQIDAGTDKTKVTARNFIIATGSSAVKLSIPGLEGEGVWTSDDAVAAMHVPKRMLILGGGAVGVELAYVFNGSGAEVTLVEMMPNLAPTMDEDLGKELAKQFLRKKVAIHLESTLERCERKGAAWFCHVKTPTGVISVEADVVLLGVGRKCNTEGLNLDKVGVRQHKRGIEVVNDKMQTHTDNIYAIGDVIGRIQLAHVASAEGIVAAEAIAGLDVAMDYKVIPDVVYTVPELASVGLSEKQAREKGYDVKVGSFSFRPLGRAMAALEQEGFIKVVSERQFGEVLGVQVIGPHASSLIHEAAAAIKLEATLDDMERLIHAHPSFAEAMGEAFHDAIGHAIHK